LWIIKFELSNHQLLASRVDQARIFSDVQNIKTSSP
jgi:hypothetical protein